MILIKKIEFMDIDRDMVELAFMSLPDYGLLVNTDSGQDITKASVVNELVRSKRFRRPDGTELRIGFSEQAADVLGLSYEAFANLEDLLSQTQNTVYEHTNKIQGLKKEIYAFKSMTRWERFLSVFKS